MIPIRLLNTQATKSRGYPTWSVLCAGLRATKSQSFPNCSQYEHIGGPPLHYKITRDEHFHLRKEKEKNGRTPRCTLWHWVQGEVFLALAALDLSLISGPGYIGNIAETRIRMSKLMCWVVRTSTPVYIDITVKVFHGTWNLDTIVYEKRNRCS